MESRSKNATRNIITGILNKFASIIMPFIVRTVIIRTLGMDYLGLDNLFAAILQVLNLSELGISSAIAFCMYRPIADGNNEKVEALYLYVKKAYKFVGGFILIAGLLVLPFLNYFIKGDAPTSINVYILYIIYIINSSLSYCLFAYKSVLLSAYQRLYIGNLVLTVSRMFTYILQLVVLCLFKDYYFYVIALPLGTLMNNIILSYYTDKVFPNIQTKGWLDDKSKAEVKHQLLGVCINKICLASRNSLDSIIVSTYLGLITTAIYNNYFYIINALVSIVLILSGSIIPGVGNSIATETVEKNYRDFRKFNFLFIWIVHVFTTCLFVLYQPFMRMWVGEDACLPLSSAALFSSYFFFMMLGNIKAAYTEAAGLWWENKNRAVLEVILNVALNIMLGKIWGVNGIIIATVITIAVINFGLSTTVLFKNYFKKISCKVFFIDSCGFFIVTIFTTTVAYFISEVISDLSPLLELSIKLVICLVVSNIIFIIVYFRTKVYNESIIWIKERICRTSGKNRK